MKGVCDDVIVMLDWTMFDVRTTLRYVQHSTTTFVLGSNSSAVQLHVALVCFAEFYAKTLDAALPIYESAKVLPNCIVKLREGCVCGWIVCRVLQLS